MTTLYILIGAFAGAFAAHLLIESRNYDDDKNVACLVAGLLVGATMPPLPIILLVIMAAVDR